MRLTTELLDTEDLHNKTLSQPALLMNAKRSPLLLHTISHLIMELMDGNTKETLLMPKENLSQPVTHLSMPKESARRIASPKNGMSQLLMILTTELLGMEDLLRKTLSQLATLLNMLKVNAKKTA